MVVPERIAIIQFGIIGSAGAVKGPRMSIHIGYIDAAGAVDAPGEHGSDGVGPAAPLGLDGGVIICIPEVPFFGGIFIRSNTASLSCPAV